MMLRCLALAMAAALPSFVVRVHAGVAPVHTITFEDRVRAQEAIHRVYYAHQIGATKSFEEAVPRELLERKVRTYLKQSVALERFWGAPVTAEAIRAELARIAGSTRLPKRLREINAALAGDPILLQECLARPALVDRLARNFFAYDQRVHQRARHESETLREQLISGEIDILEERPERSVAWISLAQQGDKPNPSPGLAEQSDSAAGEPRRIELSGKQHERWRRTMPARVGEIGPVVEEREAFVVRLLLEENSAGAKAATYTVAKTSWDAWWAQVESTLDEQDARQVALGSASLQAPGGGGDPAIGISSCAPEDTWDNGTLDDMPEARTQHSAVWTGNEMIIWGGWGAILFKTGGRYDPLTDTWISISTANAPAGRVGHTAVWTGSEMVIWGGYPFDSGDTFNTGGRYDPLDDSWTPTSTANAPAGRFNHTAFWTENVMIVWGGLGDGEIPLNTGGRYDPVADTWALTSTTGAPSPRVGSATVWTGSVMIVWGGYDGALRNTGGRYDPASNTWTPTSTTGAPSPRVSSAAVWTGSVMIVWGGSDGLDLATGGRYDPASNTWTPTSTTGAPSPRVAHTAVWTGSRMVIWGQDNSGGRYDPVADVWSPISRFNAPSARFDYTSVWTGALLIVWGGEHLGPLDTGGRYDPVTDTWTPTATGANGPSAREGHAAVWTGSLMVVWGGGTGYPAVTNSGGRYDPATDTWTPTSTNNAPSPRNGPTAVWTGSLMVVWGGVTVSPQVTSTGGRYDPLADTWAPTSTTNVPPPRSGHTAVWTGSLMLVWGGTSGSSLFNSGGRYDPLTDTWTPTSTATAPSARRVHTTVWTGTLMVVWGGYDASNPLATGGRYDPIADTWTPTSAANAPAARGYHSAIWSGALMVIWGGYGGSNLATGGRYDPVTDTWTPTSAATAPSARRGHTAVWTGTVMIVWGAYNGPNGSPPPVNTGGRYNPLTDTWTPTSTAGAPTGRHAHTAVWTERTMIVWGGQIGDDVSRNGGRYVGGPQVPEVAMDLDFIDAESVAWSSSTTVDAYDLYGGTMQPAGWSYDHTCLQTPLTSPGAVVTDVPQAGEGRYYLVAGANECGMGTLGHASDGQPRPNLSPCP